jgi:hypothetical protein
LALEEDLRTNPIAFALVYRERRKKTSRRWFLMTRRGDEHQGYSHPITFVFGTACSLQEEE